MSTIHPRNGLLPVALTLWLCATGCKSTAPRWPFTIGPSSSATLRTDSSAQASEPIPSAQLTAASQSWPEPTQPLGRAAQSVPAPPQAARLIIPEDVAPTIPQMRVEEPPRVTPPLTALSSISSNNFDSPVIAAPDRSPVQLQERDSAAAQHHSHPDPQLTPPPGGSSPPMPLPPATLALQIDGVRPASGEVKIAVFTAAAGFPDSRFAQTTLQLPASASQLTVPLQPTDRMAVAVYQDSNRDGQLNRNRFGIPVEPYGFSNAAESQRGPPSFDAAAVEPKMLISHGRDSIIIQLRE